MTGQHDGPFALLKDFPDVLEAFDLHQRIQHLIGCPPAQRAFYERHTERFEMTFQQVRLFRVAQFGKTQRNVPFGDQASLWNDTHAKTTDGAPYRKLPTIWKKYCQSQESQPAPDQPEPGPEKSIERGAVFVHALGQSVTKCPASFVVITVTIPLARWIARIANATPCVSRAL